MNRIPFLKAFSILCLLSFSCDLFAMKEGEGANLLTQQVRSGGKKKSKKRVIVVTKSSDGEVKESTPPRAESPTGSEVAIAIGNPIGSTPIAAITSTVAAKKTLLDLADELVVPAGSNKGIVGSWGSTYKSAWETAAAHFRLNKTTRVDAEKACIDFITNRVIAANEENKTQGLPTIHTFTKDPTLKELEIGSDALKVAIRNNLSRYQAIAHTIQTASKDGLSINFADLQTAQAAKSSYLKQLMQLIGIQFSTHMRYIKEIAENLSMINQLLCDQKAGYSSIEAPCDLSNPHDVLTLSLRLYNNLCTKEVPAPKVIPAPAASTTTTPAESPATTPTTATVTALAAPAPDKTN